MSFRVVSGAVKGSAATLLALLLMASPAAAGRGDDGKPERPAALVPMYVAFAALQGLDAHSTMSALGDGARESNPVVRSALDVPAGLFLLKSGTAAGVVLLNEKIWPRNRAAAVITMIALNSAYA